MIKYTPSSDENKVRNVSIVKATGFDVSELTTVKGRDAVVIKCPGEDDHTTIDGYFDTVVFLDGSMPAAYCFHSSCSEKIKRLNKQFWIASNKPQAGESTKAKTVTGLARKGDPKKALRHKLFNKALRLTDTIKRDFSWSRDDTLSESPTAFDTGEAPDGHWEQHLQLFKNKGNGEIWLGEQRDSGYLEKHMHFWPLETWLDRERWFGQGIPLYPLTTPCLFKPLGYSRCKDNVLSTPFYVIEHDKIGHDSQLAFYRFLREELGLRLRALIDTAGKSIHAWWDSPSDEMRNQLNPMLEAWGFDKSSITKSQPMRVAGVPRLHDYSAGLREDNFIGWQRLIYLDLNA